MRCFNEFNGEIYNGCLISVMSMYSFADEYLINHTQSAIELGYVNCHKHYTYEVGWLSNIQCEHQELTLTIPAMTKMPWPFPILPQLPNPPRTFDYDFVGITKISSPLDKFKTINLYDPEYREKHCISGSLPDPFSPSLSRG